MLTAHARIESPKSRRYLAQLCKHFAHKVAVDWDESRGSVDFGGGGTCIMTADDTHLSIDCRATDPAALGRVKYIVEDHVTRFGWREELRVDWVESVAD